MRIEQRTEGDVIILSLKGKMVGGEGDEILRDRVEDLVEAGRVNIVLDLAGVPYIDSACLGEIVRCHTLVSRENGKLKLVNLNERLRSLLSRTRLDWVSEGDSDEDAP
jgi:anti-sigma B factor antagonist